MSVDARPAVAVQLAGDDADDATTVVVREQRDVARLDVLVARLASTSAPPAGSPRAGCRGTARPTPRAAPAACSMCWMPGAGRHPLRRAVRDQAAAARRVLVLEGAVDDVRHRLEAAVRVPRRALRLARARTRPRPCGRAAGTGPRASRSQPRERPPDDEPLALELACAVTTCATGRQAVPVSGRRRDARQREGIGGHCGHLHLRSDVSGLYIQCGNPVKPPTRRSR